VLRHLLAGGEAEVPEEGAFPASPDPAISRHATGRAEESSKESFPASDPPAY
jgi:hypothetical protein